MKSYNKIKEKIQYDKLSIELDNFFIYDYFDRDKLNLNIKESEISLTFATFFFTGKNFKKFLFLLQQIGKNNSKISISNFLYLFYLCSLVSIYEYVYAQNNFKTKNIKQVNKNLYSIIKYFFIKLKLMKKYKYITYFEYFKYCNEFFIFWSGLKYQPTVLRLFYNKKLLDKIYKKFCPTIIKFNLFFHEII